MEITSDERARLRSRAQVLDVVIRVGKAGVTPGLVAELSARLKKDGLVKVRLLAAAREESDRRTLAEDLAHQAQAALVEVRGHTVVLWRPKGRRRPNASAGPKDG